MNNAPDILHALRTKISELEKDILSPTVNDETCRIKRHQHFVLERVIDLVENPHGESIDLTFQDGLRLPQPPLLRQTCCSIGPAEGLF